MVFEPESLPLDPRTIEFQIIHDTELSASKPGLDLKLIVAKIFDRLLRYMGEYLLYSLWIKLENEKSIRKVKLDILVISAYVSKAFSMFFGV